MAKTVRLGCTYRVTIMFPLDPGGPRDGDIVTVVNVPGGVKRGPYRNVMDRSGRIWFYPIRLLTPFKR